MRKLLIALMTVGVVACSKVPAGHVGVKAYLLGGEKGVDSVEVGPGRYWIGMNEELYLFPTFTQTDKYVGQQSISFQSSEGMTVAAPIGVSYAVNPNKVSVVFQKYRKGIDEISDLYLRQMIADAFVTIGGTKPIESVYGEGKAELITQVEARVREQVADIGINVERIYWVGQPKLPDSVVASINAKINATQKAQQRENEIQQAKAEAQKAIETASGEAQSTLIKAKAEADAIRLRADALKQNQELVQLTLAERWDGKLPTQMLGNAVPLLNIK